MPTKIIVYAILKAKWARMNTIQNERRMKKTKIQKKGGLFVTLAENLSNGSAVARRKAFEIILLFMN